MPDYLIFDSTPENDTILSGSESILKCNSSLLFLEPDSIGNNTLNLGCGEDGNFVLPDPWPLCVVKCEVSQISADLGYAPIDGKLQFPSDHIDVLTYSKVKSFFDV